MKKGLFIIAGVVVVGGMIMAILLWLDTSPKNSLYCRTLFYVDGTCLADARCQELGEPIGDFGDMHSAGCRARTKNELAELHKQAELCTATNGTWSNPQWAGGESCICAQPLGVNSAEVGLNSFVRDHGCIDEKTACTELIGGEWKTPTLIESHKVYGVEREECYGYFVNNKHRVWHEETNECIGSTYKPSSATCRFNGRKFNAFNYLDVPSFYTKKD